MSHLPLDPNIVIQPLPTGNTDPFDGPAEPPTVSNQDEERSVLWRAIYGLGRNFDAFVSRQHQEAQDSRSVLQSIAQQLQATTIGTTAPATTTTTSGGSSAPRVREPRMFDGSPNQVDPFVREITNSLFLQRRAIVTDREKCLYFGFYLKDGSPSSWYTSVEKNTPNLLDNYPTFLAAFKVHFEDSDRYATALAKLRKLKQAPGSAATYASRFRELAWELDLTDQTSIQMFYDGLKDNVKDAITVAMINDTPMDFDEYVKMVINIDNKLHRRNVERQIGASKSSFPSKPPAPSYATSSTTAPPMSTSSNNDVTPMEIDALQRGPLTSAERERHRAEGLCFYCGKGKHNVSNCPNMSEAAKLKYKGKKANPSGKA